jgi:hypothetical protein
MKLHQRLFVRLALAGLLVSGMLPTAAQADTGGVRVVFAKGGFIVGLGGGEGVLTFRGHHVSGMSVGFTIGASTTQLSGHALNLRSPGDIQGNFAVIGAGGAACGWCRWRAIAKRKRCNPAAQRSKGRRRTVGGGGRRYDSTQVSVPRPSALRLNIAPRQIPCRAVSPDRRSVPCLIASASARAHVAPACMGWLPGCVRYSSAARAACRQI